MFFHTHLKRIGNLLWGGYLQWKYTNVWWKYIDAPFNSSSQFTLHYNKNHRGLTTWEEVCALWQDSEALCVFKTVFMLEISPKQVHSLPRWIFIFKKHPSFQLKSKANLLRSHQQTSVWGCISLQAHRPWKAYISRVSTPCMRGNERSKHREKIKLCS